MVSGCLSFARRAGSSVKWPGCSRHRDAPDASHTMEFEKNGRVPGRFSLQVANSAAAWYSCRPGQGRPGQGRPGQGRPGQRVAPARVAPARVAPARVVPARVAPARVAPVSHPRVLTLLPAMCGAWA
eukprot:gene3718-biopygen8265